MNDLVQKFYQVFIRPVDPGLFITKYAFKLIAACAVALFFAYFSGMGEYIQWCFYGAIAIGLFRAGSTLQKRKRVAITLTSLLVLLIPISSFIGNFTFIHEVYLFGLAFCVFFCAVLGVPAGIIGLGVLVINMFALYSPAAFVVGILRSGAVLCGAVISYLIIFYLWPMRPEKILSRAGAVALTDLGDYFRFVASSSGSFADAQELSRIHERCLQSIRRYRSFMEAINVDPVKEMGSYEGPAGLYALLIRMLEAVVGLASSKSFAEHSPVFTDLRFKFSDVAGKSSVAFDVLAAKLSTGKGEVDLAGIDADISDLEESLLQLGAYKRDESLRNDFLEAWGAIYGLRNLSFDFAEMDKLFCSGGKCFVR